MTQTKQPPGNPERFTIDADEEIIGKLTIADFKGLIDAVTGPLPEVRGAEPSPSPQS